MAGVVNTRSWVMKPAASSGSATHRLRISAAHDEWNHVGIALTAMHEGFFAEEGLDNLELITFPEETGELEDREALQVDLIAQGLVDIGIDPRTTFVLEANDRGLPVAIVAARRKNHAFVVIGQRGMSGVEDLRGMTLYQSQRGGATDVMLRQILKDTGLDPEEDVKIEYTGGAMHDSAGTVEAFLEGRRGPAILTTFKNQIASLTEQGYQILADLRTRYPSRHDRVTAANDDFVRAHPQALKGFLKGMMRACHFVLDRPNAARFKEVLQTAGYLTSEREERNYDNLFEGWQERVSLDLALPRDGIELIVDEEQRAGRLPGSFQVDSALRLDALAQAQRELGLRES